MIHIENEIRLIAENKIKFQQILKVLNNYHEMNKINSELYDYRRGIEKALPEAIDIYLKPLGGFGYQVRVSHLGVEKIWIHIDGIAEERERLVEKGKGLWRRGFLNILFLTLLALLIFI